MECECACIYFHVDSEISDLISVLGLTRSKDLNLQGRQFMSTPLNVLNSDMNYAIFNVNMWHLVKMHFFVQMH